jgi:hypothetical protein
MTFVVTMWSVWGALVVLFFVVHLYQSRLARDEDDEIFLGEGFENERAAQAEIAAKVNKVEPALKGLKWLVALATLFVVGYYIWDIVNQFK